MNGKIVLTDLHPRNHTREQTLDLIEKIKGIEEVKPVDLRAELETQLGYTINEGES